MKRIRPTIVLAVVVIAFGVGCVGMRPYTHNDADWEAIRRQQQEEAHRKEKQEKDLPSEKPDPWTWLYYVYLASGLGYVLSKWK